MKRKETEYRIANLLEEIGYIYKEYNPDADYLSLTIYIKDNYLGFNNVHWKEDKDYPIEFNTFDLFNSFMEVDNV